MLLQTRFAAALTLSTITAASALSQDTDDRIAFRFVDPTKERISLHWKSPDGLVHGNLATLKTHLEQDGRHLLFGMNGGMYTVEQGPVGLYIEDGRLHHRLDRRRTGKDNFHMQPNGVFGLLKDGTAFVRTTDAMTDLSDVLHATQSGPMLLVNGTINSHFTPGSRNVHVRNGVGILQDGLLLFAISREPINFHDFASWFKEQGCTEALYLDGAVSRAYIPEQGISGLDGALGVLIGVTAKP